MVTPSRRTDTCASRNSVLSNCTLIPLSSPSVVSTSRRLELLKLIRSGSRFAGFSSAWLWLRACCRSASIGGFGRLFSILSRMVRSSSAALDSARRLVPSISMALWYSMRAPSSCPFVSSSRAWLM